ncbi:MFS transporter [Clavibacter zhangzhiyongii]|uniref:MFS transporter n=1 Tax=Clavibacter zhangzhiyongii TaxID=2768071 RepID=UPI0039E1207C
MPSPSAPTLSPTPAPTRDVRRARVAVGILFFTNGAIFANLLPRYPSIKAELGLANVEFGAAVAASPLGALIAGLAAGVLIRRYRSARVAVAATVVASVGILLAGLAPGWLVLAGALFLAGAMDSITDVAQNSHALRVQRLYGRSIINSFHAVWSIGAVAGGIMGAAAAQIRLPLAVHLSVSAVLFSALAALSLMWLLKGPEPEPGEGGAAHAHDPEGDVARAASPRALGLVAKYGVLLALVIIASGGAIVEDAGSTWSAIYLSRDLGSSAFVAGLGFISLQGMQFIGRMLGDRMVDRFGQRAIARLGGVLVLLGMGGALAFPSIVGTIVGFGVAGFGVATLIPAAMQAADELPGFKPGTGLTIVGWLLRVGFLVSPPVVGAIADASSLRYGLIFIPAAGLLVLVFSRVLATRRAHPAAQTAPGASS